ncbi:hypothetical protein LZC95_15410 [Pendulispora brunnea]|uniref:Uncharacterized protein n=1 Tax=Pendulispora brunnea TaxID=2905690 RepID=A0ABZ2KHQ1_9BACT
MRLRFLLLLIGSLSMYLAFSVLAVACTDTTTLPGIDPITGIQIRSDVITAGKGCGTGDTQVYKYTAVVTDTDGLVRAAATYDCFADGVFQALTQSDSGFLDFNVDVYAFNAKTFGDGSAVAAVVNQVTNTDHQLDRFWAGRTLTFTWDTNCQTTQQSDVEVVAVCEPLRDAGSDGIIVLPASFTRQDGTPAGCNAGAASVRASVRGIPTAQPPPMDAGADASKDAGDAAPSDAGDAGNAGDGGTTPAQGTLFPCPNEVRFTRVKAPADHTIDVELLGVPADAGAPPPSLGRTTCRGSVAPFVSTTATCDPVQ